MIQHAVPDEMIEQGETALITNGEKTPEEPDENTSMSREKMANMKASVKSAVKSEEDEGSSENEVNVSDGGLGKDDEQQRKEVMEELEKEYDENLREEIFKNISKRLETENAGIQESSKKSPGQRELETKASEHVGELRSKDNEEGRVEGRIIENSIDNIEDSKSPSKVLPKKERKEKIRNVIPQLRVRANIKFAEIKGKGIKLQQPVVTDPPNDERPPTERELEGDNSESSSWSESETSEDEISSASDYGGRGWEDKRLAVGRRCSSFPLRSDETRDGWTDNYFGLDQYQSQSRHGENGKERLGAPPSFPLPPPLLQPPPPPPQAEYSDTSAAPNSQSHHYPDPRIQTVEVSAAAARVRLPQPQGGAMPGPGYSTVKRESKLDAVVVSAGPVSYWTFPTPPPPLHEPPPGCPASSSSRPPLKNLLSPMSDSPIES